MEHQQNGCNLFSLKSDFATTIKFSATKNQNSIQQYIHPAQQSCINAEQPRLKPSLLSAISSRLIKIQKPNKLLKVG
ncbi:hypothetical protein [Aeromonas enteropelogenes]|uniref:hypothetical protein n=1 Tax=Aeromonas enteropelogenes TaxID=29489 RepID=UPI003BA000D8